MARKGRAGPRDLARRLGLVLRRAGRRRCSCIPGTGPLAAIALEFGPWEYFSLFVLAMAMVAGLAEASLVKGLLSTAIGLLITVIGTDPIGSVPRFTFGSEFIGGGFPFLPVLIGIFAFAQIMTDIEKMRQPEAPSGRGGGRRGSSASSPISR